MVNPNEPAPRKAMRFVLAYPEVNGTKGDLLDAGEVGELAAAAEAAGFAGFAFTEHPIPAAKWLERGGHQSLDPFVALAFAAAATERLQLLTYLTVPPWRNPLLLAKTAATLDRLSHGRLILGVGTGYLKAEYAALGVEFEERNRLFDEALEIMPLAWSGDAFSYSGQHFEAKEVIQLPSPARTRIPIWIGGNSRLSRRRAAMVQGWMPMGVSVEVARTVRTPPIGSHTELSANIAEVKEMAGGRAAELDFVFSYPHARLGNEGVAEAARHQEEFDQLAAAGVTWVVIASASSTAEANLAFVEAFGSQFTPS
jgi:probable F420-dependent oxidoreductase